MGQRGRDRGPAARPGSVSRENTHQPLKTFLHAAVKAFAHPKNSCLNRIQVLRNNARRRLYLTYS